MPDKTKHRQKTILDLELMNTLNEKGCAACGKKFSLGETVVVAHGNWGAETKFIHENETIYDEKTSKYYEKNYYRSLK
ncbi:MAG: hypothetical protein JW786_13575 [Desulfobacterales bacterium]|nr:hypothetical protein [Desulfobacterales bacterium]